MSNLKPTGDGALISIAEAARELQCAFIGHPILSAVHHPLHGEADANCTILRGIPVHLLARRVRQSFSTGSMFLPF